MLSSEEIDRFEKILSKEPGSLFPSISFVHVCILDAPFDSNSDCFYFRINLVNKKQSIYKLRKLFS
jgi:hypothetical protein